MIKVSADCKEKHFVVSDGVTGEWTIAGWFPDAMDAIKAFKRCHKIDYYCVLVYESTPKNAKVYELKTEFNGKKVLSEVTRFKKPRKTNVKI